MRTFATAASLFVFLSAACAVLLGLIAPGDPITLGLIGLSAGLFAVRNRARRWLDDLIWSQRAALCGNVSLMTGASHVPPFRQGFRRSSAIIGSWLAVICALVAYWQTGGAFASTAALASIAGLYWLCPHWQIYRWASFFAVAGAAYLTLVTGGGLAAVWLMYAALLLGFGNTPRRVVVLLAAMAFCHGTLVNVPLIGLGLACGLWFAYLRRKDASALLARFALRPTNASGAKAH